MQVKELNLIEYALMNESQAVLCLNGRLNDWIIPKTVCGSGLNIIPRIK
jgi:hypothetical protein